MSDSGQLLQELTAFCKSNSLCEGGLREIIIERHNWTPNHPSVSSYNFFLWACKNERATEGIIRYLLEYFPGAGTFVIQNRNTPLHCICNNKNVSHGMVQLLIDAFPASVHNENNKGFMPLHVLCQNKHLDDEFAVDILKLLLKRCPESARHTTNRGSLPLQFAASFQSPEFCRLLIEAYPGSERMAITGGGGGFPFHFACISNTVATAKYFYQLYPESINVADTHGYPIHFVIFGVKLRNDNPENAIEMVQFLLDCNPDVVLQELNGKIPLFCACMEANNENNTPTNLNAYHLKITKILYDAHPEAIESFVIASNVERFSQVIKTFIRTHFNMLVKRETYGK